MSVEKINLNSFRAFLFFFFGGAGCLLPFLSLHLKSTGLSTDDIRIISYVSLLFATLGPITIGPVVDYVSGRRKSEISKSSTKRDKNLYIRTILSLTVLLSAVFYCLLLSVPTVENINFREPEASFVCDDRGASLVQEKCNALNCFQYPKAEMATLENCRFNCNLPAHFSYLEKAHDVEDADMEPVPITTTTVSVPTTISTPEIERTILPLKKSKPETDISNLDTFFGSDHGDDYDDGDAGSGEDPEYNWNKNRFRRETQGDAGFSMEEFPHICYGKLVGGRSSRTCFVFTSNSVAFNVSVVINHNREFDHYCGYSLGTNFSCRIPPGLEKPDQPCKVVCDLEKVFSKEKALASSQCGQVLTDPVFTFWTYLTFRMLGDFFFSASIAVLIGAILLAAGDATGREFILPSLSYGLFAAVVGYLHSDDMSPLHLENMPNFSLGILGFGIFMVLALLVLLFATNLCVGPPDWWKDTQNVQIKHKGEFYAVLLVLILLGMLWGPIYFQVPWHITAKTGLELYVGCAAAISALVSVPLVWKAYKIVDYCGYSNILIGAFTIYILRYTGLLFIDNPWVLSVIGGMEAITLCLMLFAAIFYLRHLVPKRLIFTSQALGVAAHFCLGGGLGCLISALLSPSFSDLEVQMQNSTKLELDFETVFSQNELRGPYHWVYCVGAIGSAISAVAYFLLYHFCLKKKCLAPLYRSDRNGDVPNDSGEKGMYTPLRVIRNGKQVKDEVET